MIKIAPGKWGYFDQIIFNTNKTAFEACFAFPRLLLGILSQIVARPSALLGLDPNHNQDIS